MLSFSGGMYISTFIFSSVCEVVSGLLCDAVPVILSSSDLATAFKILLPIKLQLISAVFLIALFEAVLNASAAI